MDIDEDKFRSLALDFIKRWNCKQDGECFFTHSSLIWPVTRSSEKLILKIVKPDDDEAHAGEILEFYDGHGAVKLNKSQDNVQLLERVATDNMPSLENMVLHGQDDDATHIICNVIEQLHSISGSESQLNHLIPFRSRSDTMRKHVEEGRVEPEDRPIFNIAERLCEDLIAETQDMQMPLHGDVHHFNIMHSAERGWLAIDPKGIYGPRVYEYANLLCNPYGCKNVVADVKRMARQTKIVSERAALDVQLLYQFTFLHACQCMAWSLYDPDKTYWRACVLTAAKLANIKI